MKSKHGNHRQPKASRNETVNPTALLVRHVAATLSITVALGGVLLVVCSLIAYMTPDPDALVKPLGVLCAAMTSFFGGIIAVRIHRHRAPLPAAMLNAILLSGLMLLLSLPLSSLSSGYSAPISLLLHAFVFLLSALGAILAARPSKPKKPRRRTSRP